MRRGFFMLFTPSISRGWARFVSTSPPRLPRKPGASLKNTGATMSTCAWLKPSRFGLLAPSGPAACGKIRWLTKFPVFSNLIRAQTTFSHLFNTISTNPRSCGLAIPRHNFLPFCEDLVEEEHFRWLSSECHTEVQVSNSGMPLRPRASLRCFFLFLAASRLLCVFAVSENCRSDSHDGCSLFDRHPEIMAHTHRKMLPPQGAWMSRLDAIPQLT